MLGSGFQYNQAETIRYASKRHFHNRLKKEVPSELTRQAELVLGHARFRHPLAAAVDRGRGHSG